MAVLVRSGRTSIPGAAPGARRRRGPGRGGQRRRRRWSASPRCVPLLDALRAVLNLDNDDRDHVDYLDPGRAEALLVARSAGSTPSDVRALGRALRAREKALAARGGTPAAPVARPAPRGRASSRRLPRRACQARRPSEPRALPPCCAGRAPSSTRRGTAEEVLWTLWSGTPLAASACVARSPPGAAAARLANRDLDAMVRPVRGGRARRGAARTTLGVRNFLATLVAQEIPADTLAERGVRGACGAPADRPPVQGPGVAARRRRARAGGRLARPAAALDPAAGRPDRQPTGSSRRSATRELLAEERRLFYVACTRARQRLVVTAVASPDDEGEQPSRFLGELGRRRRRTCRGGRRGRCRWPGWSASCAARSPTRTTPRGAARAPPRAGSPGSPRETVGQRPAGPRRPTPPPGGAPAAASLSDAARCATRTSRSGLGQRAESADELPGAVVPARARPAGSSARHQAANGSATCARARRPGRRGRAHLGPGDVDELMEHVDEVWDQLAFRTPWSRGAGARRGAQGALTRFLDWHHVRHARTLLATEQRFAHGRRAPGRRAGAAHGYADRLEIDDDGQVVVVDLKTGKYRTVQESMESTRSSALYQLRRRQRRRRRPSRRAPARSRRRRAGAAAGTRRRPS